MKILFSLFWSFFKIGLFTFGGGYAMIPLIEREVIDRRKWVRKEDFLELLTLAQSAPGPISLNSSVFVGYSLAGYPGAVAAILGVILPSFVIMLLIAVYLTDLRANHYVDAAFKGMRPAVVALIAAPILNLARGMGIWKIVAAIAAAVIVWLLGVSPIWFIAAGAVAGILYAFFNKDGSPSANSTDSGDGASEQSETIGDDEVGKTQHTDCVNTSDSGSDGNEDAGNRDKQARVLKRSGNTKKKGGRR